MSNKLDKLISNFAPSWALRRAAARHDMQILSGWSIDSAYSSGNTDSRLRQHAAFGRSRLTDEEAASGGYGYDAMRMEAMDLYRNNPIARATVETTRRYCRQSKARASTASVLSLEGASAGDIASAQMWDMRATDYFNEYVWNRADYFRRPGVTLGTMQDIFVTLQFTQGDLAFIRTTEGWLTAEGIQIRTPYKLAKESNIKNGFRFNEKGRITHIYVCEFGNYGNVDGNNFRRYPINAVVFCPWHWRAAQLRGVPRLHGIIDNLRDQEEIHDRVKQKVKNEAALLSIERAGARRKAPGSTITNEDGTTTTYEEAGYGMRFRTTGKPGEDFMFAKGDAPNAQYVGLMEYDTKIISTGAGIPYKILLSMYDGSWSSNKAAQTALKTFVGEIWQNRRDTFLQRVYNIEIADAIRAGTLDPAPVNSRGISLFNKCDWTKPYFPQLDQEKEEKGRRAAFQNFTASLEDFAEEQGTTSASLRQQHKHEMMALKADAEEAGIPFEIYVGNLLANSTSVTSNKQETASDEI